MPSRGQQLGKLLNRSGDIVPASLPPKIETFSQSVTNAGKVETAALPTAIADLETIGETLSGGEIVPSSIKSNTLTQTFSENQAVAFNMADSIDAVSPIVSVFKEVPQQGFSSKGKWDVNANATNYDFFDEKPISYSSATLTPSATGDGTFTNSSAIVTPYMLSNLSYDSKSFNASTQLGNAEGIAFKSDGTAMYLIGFSNDKVWQYTLSTAYDISTASYSNKSFSVASQDGVPRDVRFKPDGTIMYVIASTAPDSVYQYTLSTAWDISTASYANKSLNVQSQSANPAALVLSPDGTKVYIGGYGNKTVFQYNLSTAWDLSTGSYSNNSFATTANFNYSHSALELNSDASKLFVGAGDYYIGEFSLPSDGNVSNASYVATYDVRNTTVGSKNIGGMAFANNGAKFYIFGNNDMHAYQFSSTASLAFNAADVGKKVVGNSGSAIITATSGTYKSVTAFADTSAISSWQLFGAEGKSDGSGVELTGFNTSFDWLGHDKTTPSSTRNGSFPGWGLSDGAGDYQRHCLSPNGDYYYMYCQYAPNNYPIFKWELTTPYDLSTMSYVGNYAWSYYNNTKQMMFSSDGNQFITNNTTYHYIRWQTAVDGNYSGADTQGSASSTTGSRTFHYGALITDKQANANWWFWINEAGTKLFVGESWYDKMYSWDISTAWDLSTVDTSSQVNYAANSQIGDKMFVFKNDGTEFLTNNKLYQNFSTPYNSTSALTVTPTTSIYNGTLQYVSLDQKTYLTGNDAANVSIYTDLGQTSLPYSTYSPALTNSSNGQINSASWLDINSMTADETKNDGDVFYAVSVDNRTSWSVAKASDGVRKIARNNSGTWQYNNDGGTFTPVSSLADAEYSSQFSIATANNKLRDIIFNSDGTKMYLLWFSPDVKQFSLSTAYDISTAVYDSVSLTTNNEETLQTGMKWNNDGTKLYIIGYSNDKVHEYILTTAYDLSTGSYNNVFFSVSSQMATPFGLTFKSDGTKFYVTDNGGNIYQYSLSIAWDMSSAAYDNISFSIGVLSEGLIFNSLGTKLYYVNSNILYRWNLSTAWDISTLTSESSLDIDSDLPSTGASTGLAFNGDESNIYVTWRNADGVATINLSVLGYSTSETWVDGTNNNEHATIQEALAAQSFNRMNKAQLDAIADGYHFSQTSAETHDLMIAPYVPSGTSPISDGVTINYDAEALIREAIPGTDYIAEFPNPTTLNITAVGAANLKIRAQ